MFELDMMACLALNWPARGVATCGRPGQICLIAVFIGAFQLISQGAPTSPKRCLGIMLPLPVPPRLKCRSGQLPLWAFRV